MAADAPNPSWKKELQNFVDLPEQVAAMVTPAPPISIFSLCKFIPIDTSINGTT